MIKGKKENLDLSDIENILLDDWWIKEKIKIEIKIILKALNKSILYQKLAVWNKCHM